MAYHDTRATMATDLPHRIVDGVKSFFTIIGNAMVFAASTDQRLRTVERLSAKSDAELAALGLKREDIVRHVFLDMLDV